MRVLQVIEHSMGHDFDVATNSDCAVSHCAERDPFGIGVWVMAIDAFCASITCCV